MERITRQTTVQPCSALNPQLLIEVTPLYTSKASGNWPQGEKVSRMRHWRQLSRRIESYLAGSRSLLADDFVLIYTMGRVGSTSVESIVKNSLHTHSLYGNPPSRPRQLQKFGRLLFNLRNIIILPAKRYLLRARKELKIIVLYRDPVARNPSMFMKDLPFWLCEHSIKRQGSNRNLSQDFLIEAYKETFPHNYPSLWVREELSRFLGCPAERLMLGDRNWVEVNLQKTKTLIVRTEAIEEVLPKICQFLGVDLPDVVPNANSHQEAWYKDLYKDFVNRLKLDDDLDFDQRFRIENGYRK